MTFGAARTSKAQPCHRCGKPTPRLFWGDGVHMDWQCANTPLNEAPHRWPHGKPGSDLEREEVFR